MKTQLLGLLQNYRSPETGMELTLLFSHALCHAHR